MNIAEARSCSWSYSDFCRGPGTDNKLQIERKLIAGICIAGTPEGRQSFAAIDSCQH